MSERFDVIIVGASFAGLAVASRLRGNVLLIDKYPLGSFQRSACGTFLSVPQTLNLMGAVVQVSRDVLIHAPGVPAYQLDDPLCTLDYDLLCQGLLAQGSATFLEASFQGLEGGSLAPEVVTGRGRFRARCVVDASGWQAVVASSLDPELVDRSVLSYGLETVAAYQTQAFYFWLDRATMEDGVAWIFPADGSSRLGLASYQGETVKAARVREFVRVTGADPSTFHGGFFPSRLRRPTVGNIFLVGDSAGQCLPLTGEGIRPAIFFGQQCGDFLQRVIDGEMSSTDAQAAYSKVVEEYRWHYRFLALAQRRLPRLARPLLRGLLRLLEVPAIGGWCLRNYLDMMCVRPAVEKARRDGVSSSPNSVPKGGVRLHV